MKWKYYPLADDDAKAKNQIFRNLSVGAEEHTLTRKLLVRFAEATGSIFAIAFETLDLESDCLYEYGSYCGGEVLREAIGAQPVSWTDSPIWGLIDFVDKWLYTSKDAVVLCENWVVRPEHLIQHPRESRVSCYGDEVYHVLCSADAGNHDSIECMIRESEHYFATGVCSQCDQLPQGEIPSEEFFDLIVTNTTYIFTPAFDGEGYLVWSPVPLDAVPNRVEA
jgi:hypothetical protein